MVAAQREGESPMTTEDTPQEAGEEQTTEAAKMPSRRAAPRDRDR
jgi:hypothetical protein